jgi:hypothetical protein
MSWLFIDSYVRLAPAVDQGRNEPGDCGLRLDEGLTGSYSGPEVDLWAANHSVSFGTPEEVHAEIERYFLLNTHAPVADANGA